MSLRKYFEKCQSSQKTILYREDHGEKVFEKLDFMYLESYKILQWRQKNGQ